MKRRIVLTVGVMAVLAVGFGLGTGAERATAAPATAAVGLGSPAADVIATDGHPASISFGPEMQTWFYAEKDGAVRARYEINQGLVVKVRHGK